MTTTFAGIVIKWLGQACFLLSLGGGTHILIDPPHPEVGYAISARSIATDAVFVSHNHPDHNFVEAAIGTPQIVTGLTQPGTTDGTMLNGRLVYKRIFAYHDNEQGKLRGPDTITVFQANGLRIVHLGDLGQLALTPDQIQQIGHVDVLMIPVGGFFTIDGNQAVEIVRELHPRVILPMHYGTPALTPDLRDKLAPADGFLAAMKGIAQVVTVKKRDLTLSVKSLPKKTTIYILRYE